MVSELEHGESGLTVEETFSLKRARESGDTSALPKSYTERFEEICPSYMAIGMTYEQFWYGDASMVVAYRKADRLRTEITNRNAWLQGMYFYEALCDVAPILRAFSKARKPVQYRNEPFELNVNDEEETQARVETKEQKADKRARTVMEMFMVAFNQKMLAKEKGDK